MTAQPSQIREILEAMSTSKNEIRSEAEKSFNQLKKDRPDELCTAMLAELQNQHNTHQIKSEIAVYLNTLFCWKSPKKFWKKLGAETQQTLRSGILQILLYEQNVSLRNTLARTLAQMVSLTDNIQPQFLEELKFLFSDPNKPACPAAFRLLVEILLLVDRKDTQILLDFAQPLMNMYSQLEAPKPVLVECLDLLTTIVLLGRKKQNKALTPLLERYVIFLTSLTPADDATARSFLGKLSTIMSAAPSYFTNSTSELIRACILIAGNDQFTEETRISALETILSCGQRRSKSCFKVPDFVDSAVRICFDFMSSIKLEEPLKGAYDSPRDPKNDEEAEDADDEYEDEISDSRLFINGKDGLERLSMMNAEKVNQVVFQYIGYSLQQKTWYSQIVALVALTEISEYMSKSDLEIHINSIIQMIVDALKDQNPRVRFSACETVGQLSLSLQPSFQEHHTAVVIGHLAELMDDPTMKVSVHSMAALINYLEEVDKFGLLPHAENLLRKLFLKLQNATHPAIIKEAVTLFAVVAGVLGSEFKVCYDEVMPVIMSILRKTKSDDIYLKGRLFECASIIGLSVGREVFEKDATELMQILASNLTASGQNSSFFLNEYVQESYCRVCETLMERCIPFLDNLIPHLMQTIIANRDAFIKEKKTHDETAVETLSSVDDDTDSDGDGLSVFGIPTKGFAFDVLNAIELITSFASILGPAFSKFSLPCFSPILEFLKCREKVKYQELLTQKCCAAVRTFMESLTKDESALAVRTDMIKQVIHVTFDYLGALVIDEELSIVECLASDLAKCVLAAGPMTLDELTVKALSEKSYHYIKHFTDLKIKSEESDDEDGHLSGASKTEEAKAEGEEEDEYQDSDFYDEDLHDKVQTAFIDILAAIMETHPTSFMAGEEMCKSFLDYYLQTSRKPAERVVAFYVIDTIFESLKFHGLPLWATFITHFISGLLDEDTAIRQAAAYGMIHAAKCPGFPAEWIDNAVKNLVNSIRNPQAREKSQVAATDNAVAALGSIIFHTTFASTHPVDDYLNLWLSYLPLDEDVEEGKRVNEEFMDLLAKSNPILLGANNANMPQIIVTLTKIYQSDSTTKEVDNSIRTFIKSFGADNIRCMQTSLDEKSKQRLETIYESAMRTVS